MLDKKSKRNSNAWAISDRSGMRFPIREMIREPGTNTFIHKSESDGIYNAVNHPQANIQKYARFGDPFPVYDAHPDIDHSVDVTLTNENGFEIFTENGKTILIY